MLSREATFEIIDRVLSCCSYYTMVHISSVEDGVTRFAKSQIHQNIAYQNDVVTIRMFHGKKEIKVATNVLEAEQLQKTVAAAEKNLLLMPDSELQLPELTRPKLIAGAAYDEQLEQLFSIAERARSIGENLQQLEDGYTASGMLSLYKSSIAIGNNKGLRRYSQTGYVSGNVLVEHESGATGFSQQWTSTAQNMNFTNEFKLAYDKANKSIKQVALEPGEYTVILEPLAFGNLINNIYDWGFSGKSVQDGTSFLTGRENQKIFHEKLTIIEDPRSQFIFPTYFDYEGYETKKVQLIENGVAKHQLYDIRSAMRACVEPTGHSTENSLDGGIAQNIVISQGDSSMEQLIASTKRGILITRFHYINVIDARNAVLTGLTRDGTFLIEDGKIKSGIKNLRFTESMLRAFNQIEGITSDRKLVPLYSGTAYVPGVKLSSFHFTGNID